MPLDSRHRRAVKRQAAGHTWHLAPQSLSQRTITHKLGRAVISEDYDRIDATLRATLRDVLGLSEARTATLNADTPLFGAMPELDSMAVAGLLTEIEERLGILIEDDEVDGDMLATFGALTRFATEHIRR